MIIAMQGWVEHHLDRRRRLVAGARLLRLLAHSLPEHRSARVGWKTLHERLCDRPCLLCEPLGVHHRHVKRASRLTTTARSVTTTTACPRRSARSPISFAKLGITLRVLEVRFSSRHPRVLLSVEVEPFLAPVLRPTSFELLGLGLRRDRWAEEDCR